MQDKQLPQGPVISVIVRYNEKTLIHEFLYYDESGTPTDGNVIVNSGETITYRLAETVGYNFIGAGFITPSDGVIESVSVSKDGQSLILQDEDSVVGKTIFQLIFQCPQSSNWLLSPDPQVVNRGSE